MVRYIFSQGKIRVEDHIDLIADRRNHPLGTTVLLIIGRPGEYNKEMQKPEEEEQQNAPDCQQAPNQW